MREFCPNQQGRVMKFGYIILQFATLVMDEDGGAAHMTRWLASQSFVFSCLFSPKQQRYFLCNFGQYF